MPVNISPDAIALTNKRIIIYRLKNHGQTMNFDDIFWREVADCHLKERVICWRFETRTVKKAHYYIDFLPKSQARRIYRYAQEEERMIAYHRELSLENARAASGGVVVNNSDLNETTKKAPSTWRLLS